MSGAGPSGGARRGGLLARSLVASAVAVVLAAACGPSRSARRGARARPPSTTAAPATTSSTAAAPSPPGATIAPALGGSAVATGAGSVWVGRRAAGAALTGEVVRVDPATLTVQARVPVPTPPAAMTVSGTTVWVAGGGDGALPVGSLVAIDTRTNRVVRRYGPTATPWSPVGVAAGADSVWVADNSRSSVLRVDPGTRRVTTIAVGAHPTSIACQGNDVWVGTDDVVWHVDATTNAARATLVAGTDVVAGSPYVWVSYASPSGRDTTTLDPQGAFLGTSAGTPIRAHFDQRLIGGHLAPDGNRVWVAESGDVVLLQVVGDVEAKTVPGSYLALERPPVALAATSGTVWVVAGADAPLVRWRPTI